MQVRKFLVDQASELQLTEGTCLVVLPQTPDANEFYTNVIRPVLEETSLGLQSKLAPGVFDEGNSAMDAVQDVLQTEFVLCDLSVRDPNVLYYLGQASVFRDAIIMITQDPEQLPFTVSPDEVLVYEPDTAGINQLRQDLADCFSELLGMERQHIDPMATFGFSAPVVPDDEETLTGNEETFSHASTETMHLTDDEAQPTASATDYPKLSDSASAIPIAGNTQRLTTGDVNLETEMLPEGELGSPSAGGGPVGTINVDAAIKKGFEYQTLGMFKEALHEFLKVLEVKPDSEKLLVIVGNLYDELGDQVAAIDAYTQAIELNPDNFQAYSGLGICYAKRKMHYEAINAYAEAIRIKPEDPYTLSNLGASYNALKMVDDALEAYQQALALQPDSPKVHFNIGNAQFNKGNFPEAITAYEKSLELNPKYEKARRNLEKAIQKQQESH